MHEWIQDHRAMFWWLAMLSFGFLLLGLVVAPLWAVRIPPDYFTRERRQRQARNGPSPWHTALLVARNILGVMLAAAGILMLVLPGQGVLAILVGVMLTDFPGKFRVARWLVSRSAVRTSINWLRRRAGREPLMLA
jgi:hypothetical protein